ncbi:MAG: hypothetical protein HC871_00100 [Rhizobiales bacterium]|nr:hypothetical protein [Hyphomicrobiales bacterium]
MLLSDTMPVPLSTRKIEHHEGFELLVVFVGHTQCRSLHWLKQGFKHCFVAQRLGDGWIICDSLKNRIELSFLRLPNDFSLSAFYRDMGHTVLAGRGPYIEKLRMIMPEVLTCVSMVKRIVGIRSFWTLTPWQLFCHLQAMKDRWRLVE